LHSRVQKQNAQRDEYQKLVVTLKDDVEQLEYERQQYNEQIEKTEKETSQVEN